MQFQYPRRKIPVDTKQPCLAMIGCVHYTARKGRPTSEVRRFAECVRSFRRSMIPVDCDELSSFVLFALYIYHIYYWT